MSFPMPSFNSIVVRLKGTRLYRGRGTGVEFQFHSGSIKREKNEASAKANAGSFNSIVVRLKGWGDADKIMPNPVSIP